MNPDGTVTLEQVAGIERVAQPDGSWRDVDTALVVGADGAVRPGVVSVPIVLNPGGGKAGVWAPIVSTGSGGASAMSWWWQGSLPAVELAGDTATYRGVRPRVDLVVRITDRGFEQSFVLTSRPAGPLAFVLPITKGSGVVLAEALDGETVIKNKAGVAVGQIDQPVMWDSRTVDGGSGPARVRAAAADLVAPGVTTTVDLGLPATTSVVSGAALPGSTQELATVLSGAPTGASSLVVAPDPVFLADPATVYPVTVDPTVNLTPTFDTYIASDLTGDQSGASTLWFGKSSTAPVARAMFNFDVSSIAGKKIVASDFGLWENYAPTCVHEGWDVWHTSPANTATRWTSQGSWYSKWATSLDTTGYAGGTCSAAGRIHADLQPLVQSFADAGSTTIGLGVRASDETSNFHRKGIASAESSRLPYLFITYDSFPSVPSTLYVSGASAPWLATTVPGVVTTVSDPDHGSVREHVQWLAGSTVVYNQYSAYVPSGGKTATLTVPAGTLVNGVTYTLKVWANDGITDSATFLTKTLTVDTVAPAAPTICSSAFPASGWNVVGGSGAFTVTSTSIDVASWQASFDGGTSWTATAGGSPTTLTLTPPVGSVTLSVRAVDGLGHRSTASSYAFNVAGMQSPAPNSKSLEFVTLNAVAPSAETGVRFQYVIGGGTTWADIPVGQVTLAGVAVSSWPVSTVGSGAGVSAPAQLVWDALGTLGADASVSVQAVFSGSSTIITSAPPSVALDSNAYGLMYASTSVAAGSVSLQTGNLAVSSSDASVTSFGASLGIGRSFNSRQPTLIPTVGPAVFGPGWSSSVASDVSDWAKVEDLGTQVRLTDSGGSQYYFTKSGTTYAAITDAALAGYSLTATGTVPNLTFTLTDPDGGTITMTRANSSWSGTPSTTNPEPYWVSATSQAGVTGSSTFSYNGDGTPAAMFAPTPAGVTCTVTSVVAGCRLLTFTYLDVDPTTAVANRLVKVTLKTTTSAGAAVTVDVACYTYDATAAYRLSKVWDPRLAGTAGWASTCTTPVQETTYAYWVAGTTPSPRDWKIRSITQAGLAPVLITYDDTGRFSTAARTHSASFGGSTLTSTVLYGVSIAAAAGSDDSHPDLASARVALWGQSTVPLTAAVVYGPGDTVSSTDLKDGTVYALDADGHTTNTAVYDGTGQDGWRVESSDYDRAGNTIRSLTTANRDRALNPGTYTGELADLGLTGATSAGIAEALSTRTLYSADGIDVTDVFGPAHEVALPDASLAVGRSHEHTDYGSVNYPTVNPADWTVGGPLHVAVRTTQSLTQTLDAIALNETDVSETRSAYGLSATDHPGWDLRSPMATTVENGATDITTQTRYDANGNVIEQRQPSAAGVTASPGTRVTRYFSAGAHSPSACTSNVWFAQVCTISPGQQPTTTALPGLVSTAYTYDALLRPTATT